MKSYKLSNSSASGVEDIYLYTLENFGEGQAEIYEAGLFTTIEKLVNFPGTGLRVDELRAEMRRYRYHSHHIYYVEESDYLFVVNILHTKRLIRKHLFEE